MVWIGEQNKWQIVLLSELEQFVQRIRADTNYDRVGSSDLCGFIPESLGLRRSA